jgi:phage baseplate assembly protein W
MITITRQVRDFTDLDFSFQKHPITSNVSIKKNINAVKQSVVNLLTMKEGSVPFHPEIHSPIYEYLFENFSIVAKVVLQDEIRRYLNTYEPRININTVTVSYPDPNSINCNITVTMINVSEPITINVLINRLR